MSASDKEAADRMAADWARDHDELTERVRVAESRVQELEGKLSESRVRWNADVFNHDMGWGCMNHVRPRRWSEIAEAQLHAISAWRSRAWSSEAELERYHEALSNLVEAGEHVDSFLSNDGPPFKFNGKSQGVPVETALLSLHDYLNDAQSILRGES